MKDSRIWTEHFNEVNYLVCNEPPESSENVQLNGSVETFEELFQEMEELLDAGYSEVTSGSLSPDWAVRLLTELDRDEYRAVLGPSLEDKGSDEAHLQAYLIRKPSGAGEIGRTEPKRSCAKA